MTSSIYVCNVFMANRHVWSAANLKRPTRTQAFKHEMEGACHCFACFVWMVAEALATTSGVKTNTPPKRNLTGTKGPIFKLYPPPGIAFSVLKKIKEIMEMSKK